MPFIVCDRPPVEESVDYYTMVGLPGNPQAPVAPPEMAEYGVHYDITDLAPGNYTIQVSACNEWGCSLPSPLSFTVPAKCSAPARLRMVV